RLTKGGKVTSQLECDADVKSSELGGSMPTQVVTLETVVDDVLADGAAKLRITVVDAGIRERPGAEAVGDVMRAQAAAMRGRGNPEAPAPRRHHPRPPRRARPPPRQAPPGARWPAPHPRARRAPTARRAGRRRRDLERTPDAPRRRRSRRLRDPLHARLAR